MNGHRAILAELILAINKDLMKQQVDMPPASNRGPQWQSYIKLRGLHDALIEALEKSS